MATKQETQRDVMLRLLRPGSMSGRQLRIAMEGEGVKKSAPAFYMLMSKAEEAGLVEAWDKPKEIAGQFVNERWFRAVQG